jgi:hypothetical protein
MPLDLSARLWSLPASIETTSDRSAGGAFESEYPQAVTVPSPRKARLKEPPAAIAATSVSPSGTTAGPSPR